MARKAVKDYAVFRNIGGGVDIAVYYSAGGADSILNTPQQEADFIIDLLRNEKPVDYDAEHKRFSTGFETVGQGEGAPPASYFTLENWLGARASIRNAIIWQKPGGAVVSYDSWTAAQKADLASAYHTVLINQSHNLPAAPPLSSVAGDTEAASTRLSEANAWKYFTAYVAQSLVMEADVRVPWSLQSQTAEELALLFDSRNLFVWTPVFSAYTIPSGLGNCTPGDPHRIYSFLKDNNLIGSTRLSTAVKVVGWCRKMVHFSGGLDVANVFNQWQYKGLPPAEYQISGTPISDSPNAPIAHRTAGCWGTTGFLRILLRTVNIAASLEKRGGPGATHALPHIFCGSHHYMSHGDDPYNGMVRTGPDIPDAKLLIDKTTFDSWFEPANGDHLNNIGRNVIELAVEYLPTYLLKRYCNDKANGKTHANGEVFDTLKKVYTVAQLEALDLWTRMDTKITALGGCAAIPAF